MGILQSSGDVPDVGYHGIKRQAGTVWVLLSDCPSGSIVHDEKWRPLLYGKIVDAHDLRMCQASEGLSLCKELCNTFVRKLGLKDFEGCVTLQMEVLTQIDLSEATSSE
jgi:hypothetical protein